MPYLSNAKYWRDRADEVMTIADGMHDPAAKRLMLDVCAEYSGLARKAEQEEKAGTPRPSGEEPDRY